MLADVDGDRIRQAVDNLLDNALRFAPRGSVIVLAARADGPDLGIEVRDDGPGFPPGFLPHAFERFRRPDTSRSRDDGGTGLGLAIVRAIAVAHGGTASAANKPEGGGAVVRVRLPGVIDVPGKMCPVGLDGHLARYGPAPGGRHAHADRRGRPGWADRKGRCWVSHRGQAGRGGGRARPGGDRQRH
jgi:hypothetical protein